MPDTGAPHFIPFADPTDLVRDWPALSEDVAEAVADGLDEAGNAGIGSNVVHSTMTNTFTTSSTSFVDVTNLAVTITPSSATSKVLVLVYTSLSRFNFRTVLTLTDGSDNILVNPDSPGSRLTGFLAYAGSGSDLNTTGFHIVHSPNTTSPFTYKVRGRTNDASETLFVNRSSTDTDNDSFSRYISTITAIEVAG